MKLYNILNGLFYVIFGLFGALLPQKMAGLMGWELSLLGLHEVRAVSMVMAILGALFVVYTRKLNDLKPLTAIIILVTLGFAAGRVLGLIIDGTGPMQTYQELGFEIIWAAIGGFLYRRAA